MSNKPTHGWSKLQTRSSLMLLLVAAIIIEVMGAVQYIFAREGIRSEVKQRARTELQLRNLEIQNVISDVEVAVNNMQWLIDWAAATPDSIYSTLRLIIKNNPVITGCAMAFEPGYFPSQGQWYEPFAGRSDGLKGEIVHRQIGSAKHDYLKSSWYQEALTSDGGKWTEPYIDDAGSKMIVSSYTMPIHDPSGKVIGVFCSDVSLEWLADLFGSHRGAITFLTSRSGRLLACPDRNMVMTTTIQDVARQFSDTMIETVNSNMLSGDSGNAVVKDNEGNKNYIFYTPVEGKTGWSMAVIFPDKEIYAGLHRVGTYLTLFMIIGLLLMVFIMWRTFRGHKRLQAVNAEKERIGSELRIASSIQMGMLPKTFPPYPERNEVSVYGTLVPAKEVGGDLYDIYIRDEKLFFCVGDVSGKGVPASLVMAVTRSLFRTVSSHIDEPEVLMAHINKAMSEMNETSMFVTLFIGILNLRTGEMTYCNAGHCPPVIVSDEIHLLEMDANIPVGLMPDWHFTRQSFTMEPGDYVFLYTDGLTEAENAEHNQFEESRMIERINDGSWHSPHELIDDMTNAVHAFVKGADQSDDLTMMAIQLIKYIDQGNENRHSLLLSNDVQEIPKLAEFIDGIAEANGIDMSTSMSLNLAMEEAVVNVMKYAYPEGTRGDIDITSTVYGGSITFTISDSGVAFDPTVKSNPDVTLGVDERPIGGLGIHLVRQIMDSIHYERKDNKNILTLKKNF
ncbi:MAG: SpoIIE family protein phosphatase [bacterium]